VGCFLILLNDIYFDVVFSLCGDSNNPQNLCFCFCVLDTAEDESVALFEVHVELN